MDVLRKFLALPMYGAAAWLAWVVSVQTGSSGLAHLLAAAVTLSFAAWLWGLVQRRRARGEANPAILAVAVVGLVAAAGLAAAAGRTPPPHRDTAAEVGGGASLDAETFSPERLAALRAEGHPVLVNFTAAWCITCQVNGGAVFFWLPGVARAFKRSGAGYLVADWTNRDPTIAKALADQGRIGVPLYLVYGPAGRHRKSCPSFSPRGW